MQKNALLMGVMAAIAVVVGLYAWFGVKAPSEREEAQKEADAKLVSFGAGEDAAADGGSAGPQVTKLVVQAKGEVTTLERHANEWRIVSPVNAGVDSVAVDGISSQLLTGKVKHVIEEKPTPEDLKKYGLDAPRFTVTATVKSGGQTKEQVIKGGGENTFDGSIYIQRGDDPKVYSAQGGLRWALEKSTFELRDKEVLSVPEKDVTKIDVQGPTHSYALERAGDGTWKLTRPEATAADKDAVTALLAGLKSHRASSFQVDSGDARARTGVEKPVLTAVFTLKSGDPIRLDLGRPAGDAGSHLYVLRNTGHESVLAEIPEGALTALQKDPATLRDKAILSFKKEDVARIAFSKGDQTIVVERDVTDAGASEEWRVVTPKEGKAQKWKLSSLLWMLGSLKAKSVSEENPKSWTKWGLDKPERTVELYGRDGKTLAKLSLGKTLEGQETVRYARGSRDQVVEVETERLNDLPNTAEDLLDQSSLPLNVPASAKSN